MLDLSNKDHYILDKYLNKVLDDYKDGSSTQLEARCNLAEAISLAAKDGNLMPYIQASLEESSRD